MTPENTAALKEVVSQYPGPKLETRDPLQPHRDLVPTYLDRDIHNLTAYLVTVK